MHNISSLIKNNRVFFFGFLFLVALACFICLRFTKSEGFILLNSFHTNFLTILFQVFTFFGDGFFCVPVGLVIFFFRDRFIGALVLSSYILSGIIAQVLKQLITEARPAVLLKDTDYPNFIEHVTLHNYHAFPSGHTASAFALAAVLAFAIKNKNISIPLLILASVIGYSRIYLAQHFLVDVLAGAVIGVLSAMICWIILYNRRTAIDHWMKSSKIKPV